MKRFSLLMFILILFLLGFMPAPAASQSKIVLKAGHASSLVYPYQIGLKSMKEEVLKKTNEQVEIQIFPMSQLGNERDLTEGVQLGTVDMMAVSNAMITNFVPIAVVFDLPYLYQDQDHALRVHYSSVGQRVTQAIEKKVGKILAYYGGGTRSVFNDIRPIKKPEDLKGLKIRVIQNKIYIATLNAMGALSTPLPFSEVYGALQQGVIDGAENDPPSFLSMKHYEHAGYFSLTTHFVQSAYLIINWDRWNSFTPEHQKIIAEAAKISEKVERDDERSKYNEALEQLKQLGIQINDIDKRPFAEQTKTVWREAGQHMSLIEEIQKVK